MGRILVFLAFLMIPTGVWAADGIAVMEMFTAQGCSAGPAGNAVFRQVELENRDNVIALNCHITYFDNSEKKDPLSLKLCDERHRKYSRALKHGLSTPRMVISGTYSSGAHNLEMINAGVRMATGVNNVTPIQMSLSEDTLDVSLPKLAIETPVNIWLFSYDKVHQITDETGITQHVNAVRNISNLMTWDGKYMNFSYPLEETGDVTGFAILAQYGDYSEIVAAGKVEKD